MAKNEDTGWRASLFMQTADDVARADVAATARPSVVFSSKDDSRFHKLQLHFSRVLKVLSSPPIQVKAAAYNPEVLTIQKRQWAKFQLQHLDHRSLKEPSRLFESMVVVGLHPNCDLQALQRQYINRKLENSLGFQNQSRVEPIFEPQVLFAYPPDKQLPLKYKDLVSFCFPGGLEVRAVERTPSMSELSEILVGQEHLKQSDLSFVFRLQVADDSTLYGCCVLVDEIVQKPSGLLSMISEKQSRSSSLSRYVLTTRRCYCILSRLPFFDLHFGVLNSIFMEERLERLTKDIDVFDLESLDGFTEEENLGVVSPNYKEAVKVDSGSSDMTPRGVSDNGSDSEHQILEESIDDDAPGESESESESIGENIEVCDIEDDSSSKKEEEKQVPNAVLPLLRYYQYESSESSPSFQGSPCEDRNFRSDIDDTETEEASFSGQEYSNDHSDILEWAKANNHGSLQIICQYYQLNFPSRGSTVRFHPLEHLHPLEYRRPDVTALNIGGSVVDLRSCCTSLEFAEVHSALMAEEEASALSTWAVACLCGSLRLENVLTLFAGALLEKQIVFVCSNLGILSASVLSIIPLIRPYQWQSLLMPILPDEMLDFLDAPVPYIVGVKNKTSEVQSKLSNTIVVDVNKNQVKSSTIPQLPKQRELFSSLSSYHAKLVGESYLAKKRPVYECTDVQIESAKGFLSVLRLYLDSLCSNLRSHTITNVQSNNDKVSLLLKESFIDSFPHRDRPFMKMFVDTQMFSVHTDLVLSFFQKE